MFAAAQGLDVSVSSTKERRFGVSLPLIFAIGIYILIMAQVRAVFGDPDTMWHISVGRWIISHGLVPDHGIFSATMPNAPWTDGEWLAEVLMAWGYDHFGWSALAVCTALCEAAAIAILLRILLGALIPVHAMLATALTTILCFPHILARPYILTMPILVVWVAALVRVRSDDRTPSLWLIPLIVLWANLHGSVLFGLGIAGLLAGEAVLLAPDWHARIRAVRGWGCFGVMAFGAALLTPNGIDGVLISFRIATMSILPYVGEFQAMNFSQAWAWPLGLWLLSVLFAALTLGWRLPPTRVAMLVLLLTMTLKHARYSEYLALVGSLLLAPSLSLQFDHRSRNLKIDRVMAELARPATPFGILMAGVILLAVSVMARDKMLPPDARTPAAAVAEVKAHGIKGPLLNAYGFGGYLIFFGVAPFIDGRAELYGDAFIQSYLDATSLNIGQLPQYLDNHGIGWTLFPPKDHVVALLDHLPGWRRLYSDSVAVVHIREGK